MALLQMQSSLPQLSIGTNITCEVRYVGKFIGINAKTVLDVSHFISSGLLSFARGLNDTPKIAALLLVGGVFSTTTSIGIVAGMMALGGVFFIKKIANTLSYQITEMNDGQGFSANLITSIIVIGASQMGMPVSTTHVSCGSLFAIGTITKQAHWGSIIKIIVSWLITLPLATILGYLSYGLFEKMYLF